jgi:glycosyltransferase involved in cell wall biosynthesis
VRNILFIHQSVDLYGSDKTLLLLLSKLDKTQFYPVVVLPHEGPLTAALEKENIKVVIAPVLKLYRKMFSPKNMLSFFQQIKKTVATLDALNEEYQFDLIYSNTLAVLSGMIYAKKRGIIHIWHVHEIIVHPKPIAYIFPKLLNNYADVVVCNSNATNKNLVDRVSQLESKSIVIHNGIEVDKTASRISTKENLGYNETDIIITLVGRINRLKGHKWLLKTFINYLNLHHNVKLLFVGSPVEGQEYYLEEVEQFIVENNIQDKVKILPYTSNLNLIWNSTDIAVMPSTEAESFGLVAVEAMLAKKPVIGSNHGGLTEIVLHEETGYLVEPNNDKSLFEAIQKLTENTKLRSEFGEKGYQRAIGEFSVEKYVSSFEALFNSMIPSK